MRRKTHDDQVSQTPIGGLRVSLVSGLDTSDRSVVTRTLAGAPQGTPPADVSDDSEDSAEFGLHLADELLRAARHGETGHTLIELEEAADVMEIGFVMETAFENGRQDGPAPVLYDLVTAVAIQDMTRWLLSPDPSPADDFDTAERLAFQLEFATSIVITDSEDASPDDLRRSLGLLHRLNPCARIISRSEIVASGRGTPAGRGCARRVGQRMGWMLALAEREVISPVRHDVDAVVYRDPRPFHPGRLSDAIRDDLTPTKVGRIARSHGFVQLATRSHQVGSWKSAGDTVSLDPTAMSSWDPHSPAGQEMVFFGEHLNHDLITSTLNCL